jgi:hypothetical protein
MNRQEQIVQYTKELHKALLEALPKHPGHPFEALEEVAKEKEILPSILNGEEKYSLLRYYKLYPQRRELVRAILTQWQANYRGDGMATQLWDSWAKGKS